MRQSDLDKRVEGWTCPCGCDATITLRQLDVEQNVAMYAGNGEGPRVNLSATPSASSSRASAILDNSDMTTCACASCVRSFAVPTWALDQALQWGATLECQACRE